MLSHTTLTDSVSVSTRMNGIFNVEEFDCVTGVEWCVECQLKNQNEIKSEFVQRKWLLFIWSNDESNLIHCSSRTMTSNRWVDHWTSTMPAIPDRESMQFNQFFCLFNFKLNIFSFDHCERVTNDSKWLQRPLWVQWHAHNTLCLCKYN